MQKYQIMKNQEEKKNPRKLFKYAIRSYEQKSRGVKRKKAVK